MLCGCLLQFFFKNLVHLCDLWLILSLFFQPRTAHAPPVPVPTVEPVWEEETPSPASARRAGKAPPVAKVSFLCSFAYNKHKSQHVVSCNVLIIPFKGTYEANMALQQFTKCLFFVCVILFNRYKRLQPSSVVCSVSCLTHSCGVSKPFPPSFIPLPPSSPHFTQTLQAGGVKGR